MFYQKHFSCNSNKSLSVIFVFCFVLLLPVPGFSQTDKYIINFVSDPIKKGGYIEEITKSAYERVGYTINILYVPWARALYGTMNGFYDALLGATYSDARATKLLYSDMVGSTEMVFFKLKNRNIEFNEYNDLLPYVIGTTRGGWLPEEFNNLNFNTYESNDLINSLQQLLGGRIDLFISLKYSILDLVKMEFPESADKITYLEKPLAEFKYFNCFPKSNLKSDKRRYDFNRGLKLIIEDGTYNEIMNRGLHE